MLHLIGQTMIHKAYGYLGVICGWDPVCAADASWIANMNVDALPGEVSNLFDKEEWALQFRALPVSQNPCLAALAKSVIAIHFPWGVIHTQGI